ncbi:hypothetical protein [Tautonia sociabilis]|uniref:XRE family transcriptional regulator n=1 Tax=Tautonia sociabilis TaxID=2080755 RepID=A0A432MN79_9BACT|nr:hypothetical protein [Tautonia sociabilis]RUL88872.1 hypothetical protein TsocGM_04485 [Tautonia sociabilis]
MPTPDPRDDWMVIRSDLAGRIREIRLELYGENGGPLLASALDLPFHRWAEFESGMAMPGEIMLRFLMLTQADPHWLLTGEGPKFRSSS